MANKAETQFSEEHLKHWNQVTKSFSRGFFSKAYQQCLVDQYRNRIPEGLSVLEVGCGTGGLLASLKPAIGIGIDFSQTAIEQAKANYPEYSFYCLEASQLDVFSEKQFDVIVFSDLLNDLWDIQYFLESLRKCCKPSTRLCFNIFSHLWSPILGFARLFGLATPSLPQNWLTVTDLTGFITLSGFQLVSLRSEILLPLKLPGISILLNRWLSRFFPFNVLNLSHFFIARPLDADFTDIKTLPSVSVIIPARNEAGNISGIVSRIPAMGSSTEIILVEGGSSDGTWDEIIKIIESNPALKCRNFRQQGTGKGDAVRLGFAEATGDILMILDADITVQPEDLPKFFDALVYGKGELINGVRLVYPMNAKAMRFCNLVANKFFSIAFTWVLGQTVRDTLCGTKVLRRYDYMRIAAQRWYFGDFDPFGDFDLIFGAARLNLKILDLPVRYGERRYGDTNINRWSHGWLLLKMLVFSARKIKFT